MNKQSYTYKHPKNNRNENRSLQEILNRSGYNYLNQSVEADMIINNSRLSPAGKTLILPTTIFIFYFLLFPEIMDLIFTTFSTLNKRNGHNFIKAQM